MPGKFRTSQNWIGGSRPGKAVFVPPPHTSVLDCMSALERFIHERDDGLPALIRAGLGHAQFETIHPFLDGNGRVGRLLISLQLYQDKVLREPILYLSLYFKQNRGAYYDLLMDVRRTGDWEAWLQFFLDGVRDVAESAVTTSRRLTEAFASDRAAVERLGLRAGSALRVHEALKEKPILSLRRAQERVGLSFTTVASAMEALVGLGIAREITGRRRDRIFMYDQYVSVLGEETEAS